MNAKFAPGDTVVVKQKWSMRIMTARTGAWRDDNPRIGYFNNVETAVVLSVMDDELYLLTSGGLLGWVSFEGIEVVDHATS